MSKHLSRAARERFDGCRFPDLAEALMLSKLSYRWEISVANVVVLGLRAKTIDEAEVRAAADLGLPVNRVCAVRVTHSGRKAGRFA